MQILQWVLLGSDVACCCSLVFREIPKLKLFHYQFHNSMKSFIKMPLMSLPEIIFAIARYVVVLGRGNGLLKYIYLYIKYYNT